MAQEIALKLNLYGTDVAITNMEQLEQAIKISRDELKKLTIGSQEFDKMASQIKKAESSLKNLQKQAEGKDLEAQIGDFGKLGGAIGASFAGATAALQLFGKESESATAAITTAQNALTLALAARGAAEGAVVVRQYASLAATKLQTIATNVLNASTRAFFATLLTNPFTLIIAGLAAAAAAMYAFGDSEEETATTTVDLTKKLQDNAAAVVVETQKILLLDKIIKDQNSTQQERLGAYAELQKLVPTLTNLTLEQAEAEGVINEYITDQIRLLELRARAKALEEVVFEDEKKRVQEQIAALQNLNIVRGQERMELERRLKLGGNSVEFIRRELAAFDAETESIRQNLDPKKQYVAITTEIAGLQQKQTDIINGQKDATDALNKSEEQRVALLRAAFQLELERLQLQTALELKLKNQLLVGKDFTAGEAAVVTALKQRLSTQQGLIKSLEQYIPVQERFNELLDPTLIDAGGVALDMLANSVGVLFSKIEEGGPLQNLNEELEKLREQTETFKKFPDYFSPEVIANLETYVANTAILSQFLNKNINSLKNNGVEVGLLTRLYNENLKTSNDLNATFEAREAAQAQVLKIENQLRASTLETFMADEKYINLIKERDAATGKARDNLDKMIAVMEAEFKKAADETVKNITFLLVQTGKFEGGIGDVSEMVSKLNKQLREGIPAATNAFILANKQLFAMDIPLQVGGFNAEDLKKIDEEITSGRFDRFEQFATDIEDLEYALLGEGFDIRKMSYEQKLVLLREFIAKEVKETEDADNEVATSFKKRTDNILLALQNFQSALNSLAQVTSDYYAFQLDELEAYNQGVQDKIVGNTEEANQKRLEADKIYQAKRKELEKQAAKTALQISLAQAIANTAEAVTKAFAQGGPVLGQIAALAIAGINAAQIGIISSQLTSLNSMQRGGKVRKGQAGFMVQGPSHEFGGVNFGQAGLQLEGGEAVLNRVSSLRFNDLLSSINQAGGGRPLVMNNFDDSRLLEALAKQKSEPIRAYVVESDITQSQTVQRRLEQLSTL